MEKHSQIVQLREREREITFFPQGAATAPQQPVLLQQEQEEQPLLPDRLWRLARPGLMRVAFILWTLFMLILTIKIVTFVFFGGMK